MPDEKNDLRIVKTHRAIREAFVKLLQQKPFEDIIVRDILALALVNRATFYKYYSGIDDLAAKLIAEFKAFYQENITQRFSATNLATFYQTQFPEFQEKIPLMLALQQIQTRRHHLYQDQLDMVKKLFLSKVSPDLTDAQKDYQAGMAALVVVGTERYYAKKGTPIPADTLPAQWRQIVAML